MDGLYKILIVDDEEEIRQGIIKKINWKEYGFIVAGDAENGQEALEMAEKIQPDIIMTDIRMPYMSGLELAKILNERMPTTKIIVFSGCDDFEYAQKAIKLNVIEYVLKPINSLELINMLKNLKVKLDKEYDEKRNIEILQKYYIDSLPVIREQFLVGAIEGKNNEKEWNEQSKKIDIQFDEKYFSVAAVHLDSESLENSLYREQNNLMYISIKQVIDDILKKYCNFVSFLYLDNIIVLGNFNSKECINSFINSLNEACKYFKRVVGIKISAGVGAIVNTKSQISMSYKGALNALEYRVILGSGKSIYIEDLEKNKNQTIQLSEENERKLLNAIKILARDEISYEINSLFHDVENSLMPLNNYRIYFMEIMTVLLRVIQAYNLPIDHIFGNDFNCYSYLNEMNSIEEIKYWFISKAIMINERIKKERINSSKILIEKAKQYTNDNYMDCEFSVDKLCLKLHVSSTYFSTIFKKETDMSFVNYLTEVRMGQAVKLLNTTDDKTYMIAEKVGYKEANYFSYVFKRKFGVSPSKYRKS